MLIASQIASAVVALLHVGFLVLEMFLWTQPIGRKVFRQSAEKAADSAVLAANQGLYNGFLAAGIVWGIYLSATGAPHAREVLSFFLGCVIVAGVYGAATVSPRIFVVQSTPALIAFGLVWFAHR